MNRNELYNKYTDFFIQVLCCIQEKNEAFKNISVILKQANLELAYSI
jgi:hypothetical protein